MSKWKEYKEKLGDTRPWDILNPKTEFIESADAEARMDICNSCPELISLTKQCKQCGCIMPLKTKISAATCPIGKW